MNRKKGITLVELVVAMGIFMVVSTIAVGTFVTAVRMKALTSTMKESQQKIRIATEMITRLSRQANRITLDTQGPDKNLDLYFTGISTAATRFQFKADSRNLDGTDTPIYKLFMYDCVTFNGNFCTATGWGNGVDLLGGTIYLEQTSSFTKRLWSGASTLEINLNGKISDMPSNPTNPIYNDSISITTSVPLEGLR